MKRHPGTNTRKRRSEKPKPPRTSATRPASGIFEWAKSFATAFGLFLLFRIFLTQAYAISSVSMENSLLVGDYLMANKAIYGTEIPIIGLRTPAFRDPMPGEVVIFRPAYNKPVLDVVKRVIGVPGDTIQMVERQLFRNGMVIEESYVEPRYQPDVPMRRSGVLGADCCYGWHLGHLPGSVDPESYRPTRDSWGPLIVPERHYFMMGDNRDQSLDSRYAGFIPREVILGKATLIYFSADRSGAGSTPNPFTAIRVNRLGKLVR